MLAVTLLNSWELATPATCGVVKACCKYEHAALAPDSNCPAAMTALQLLSACDE